MQHLPGLCKSLAIHVVAVVKIAANTAFALPEAETIPPILGMLPITEDIEEAEYVYTHLCGLVEAGNEVILQPENLTKLVQIFMQVLGTPQQVIDFCKEWKEQPALRFVFDLDNTLGTAPHVKGDYTTCEPILHTIEYLRQVKAQGHTVVIATARRMRTSTPLSAAFSASAMVYSYG